MCICLPVPLFRRSHSGHAVSLAALRSFTLVTCSSSEQISYTFPGLICLGGGNPQNYFVSIGFKESIAV